MVHGTTLRHAERRAFKSRFEDGLVDILIGLVFSNFVFGPYLSDAGLSDFWSSFVVIPLFFSAGVAVYLLKRFVVAPRIGTVTFGPVRKAKMRRFTVVMLAVNCIAFGLGLLAAFTGWAHPIYQLSLMILLFASIAAHSLETWRFFVYGLILAAAGPVGEMLYSRFGVPHHGFPITFGTSACIIILTGLVLFARFVHTHPLPPEQQGGDVAHCLSQPQKDAENAR